jgi:hypothetical protein
MTHCHFGSVVETNICSIYAAFTATQRPAEGY